ncbi:MAG: hypothetical protein AAGF20_00320 [Pseudomonadota bacterium]
MAVTVNRAFELPDHWEQIRRWQHLDRLHIASLNEAVCRVEDNGVVRLANLVSRVTDSTGHALLVDELRSAESAGHKIDHDNLWPGQTLVVEEASTPFHADAVRLKKDYATGAEADQSALAYVHAGLEGWTVGAAMYANQDNQLCRLVAVGDATRQARILMRGTPSADFGLGLGLVTEQADNNDPTTGEIVGGGVTTYPTRNMFVMSAAPAAGVLKMFWNTVDPDHATQSLTISNIDSGDWPAMLSALRVFGDFNGGGAANTVDLGLHSLWFAPVALHLSGTGYETRTAEREALMANWSEATGIALT